MKQLTFNLTITLGNEGMVDYDDLSTTLYEVSRKLDTFYREGTDPNTGDGKELFDLNGNTVGSWTIA